MLLLLKMTPLNVCGRYHVFEQVFIHVFIQLLFLSVWMKSCNRFFSNVAHKCVIHDDPIFMCCQGHTSTRSIDLDQNHSFTFLIQNYISSESTFRKFCIQFHHWWIIVYLELQGLYRYMGWTKIFFAFSIKIIHLTNRFFSNFENRFTDNDNAIFKLFQNRTSIVSVLKRKKKIANFVNILLSFGLKSHI